MPFRLEFLLLKPMGWGAEAVVWVARTTASWPDATVAVPHIPAWGLAVLSLGIAWLGLWRTRLRLAGVAAIAAGPGVAGAGAAAGPAGVRRRAADRGAHRCGRVGAVTAPARRSSPRDSWLQYWAAGPPQPMPAEGTGGRRRHRLHARAVPAAARTPMAPAALLVRGATHPDGCAASLGDRGGGAGARAVSETLAEAGGSFHRLAQRRRGDLAAIRMAPAW